jgi:hypothetical protein
MVTYMEVTKHESVKTFFIYFRIKFMLKQFLCWMIRIFEIVDSTLLQWEIIVAVGIEVKVIT